ncbi:MAG: 30S ribosomal protein S4 [archaeon]
MGDPKRLNRLYDVPRMKWNKQRILADRKIMDEYGLRTKKELWKAETTVRELRKRARLLLAGRSDNYEVRKNELLGKLIALGIFTKDHKIEDVLKLTLTDFLDRRLQTIVLRKGLALTPLQSRQLIVHGHIAVNGRKRNIPGSIVRADEVIAYTKTHIKNVIDKSIEMKGKPISKEIKKDKQAPAKIENKEESTE